MSDIVLVSTLKTKKTNLLLGNPFWCGEMYYQVIGMTVAYKTQRNPPALCLNWLRNFLSHTLRMANIKISFDITFGMWMDNYLTNQLTQAEEQNTGRTLMHSRVVQWIGPWTRTWVLSHWIVVGPSCLCFPSDSTLLIVIVNSVGQKPSLCVCTAPSTMRP